VIYADEYVESERVTNGVRVELSSTTFTTTFHTSEPVTSPVTSRATSAVPSTTTGDANIILLFTSYVTAPNVALRLLQVHRH